jgi:hypothetical protein
MGRNHASLVALKGALVLGAALGGSLFCLVLTPQSAAAAITQTGSGCTGAIDGQPVDQVFTSDNPIVVKEHTDISVTMTMSSPIHRRQIFVGFGVGPRALASDETDPTGATTTISVDKYATYGVGLYQVQVVANGARGDTCTIDALVRVEGNPLATVAGGAATGVEVLSLLGIGAAAFGGANPGEAGTGVSADPADDPLDSTGMPKDPWAANTPVQAIDRMEAGMGMFGFCALAALPALFLTSAAMAGGAAPTGAPIRLRRVHWRPRFSIVGMGSGVLGGLAAIVLLQQTGRLFPSYEILGRALVAGLLAGILIPSLTRLIAVRRANRRVAAREMAINAAVSQRAAAAPVAAAPPAVAPPETWVATHRVTYAGAPVRSEPSDAAGQTAELSAGTAVRIVEERGTWARVQSASGAEGWMNASFLERMT